MPKKRDYNEIIRRVNSLKKNLAVHQIGTVCYDKDYPLYCLIAGDQGPNILISGGVHGDEIAGVHTVLKFFEDHVQDYFDRFTFFAFPCINPSGFEANTLETAGLNLNRLFGVNRKTEIELIEEYLGTHTPKKYLFTMDFHESDDIWKGTKFPNECWIYETTPLSLKHLRIGEKMLAELPPNTPVCQWPKIYGDINSRGVIWYPESCGNPEYALETSFDAYLQKFFTNHSFTTETPIRWSLEKRVNTHLSLLSSALKHSG